jgi:Flp pilus assembly protein TadG
MRNCLVRRLRGEEGSSLVEFSLVSFLFIILLLSVVEMGRMVLVYNTMANCSRAGARYAIVHGGDRTIVSGVDGPSGPGNTIQVETVVKNYAKAGLVNPANLVVTVAYPNGSSKAGSPVTVTVQYPYNPIVGYFSVSLSKTLASTSEGIITF